MSKKKDNSIDALVAAFEDVEYPSEQDYPFEVFGDVSEMTLDEFLGDLVEHPEFANIKSVVESNLSDVKVVKFGQVTPCYLIVGKCPGGRSVIVRTFAAET